MAPIPQEHPVEQVGPAGPRDAPLAPEAVVISGMSGLLPGCHNVEEFAEKLYNKENLVKQYEPRWQFEHPELGEHFGRIPGLDRFDAQFFMVHYRMGNALDAMARKVLENTYQAIFDAGMSPAELSTQRVGVYIGVGATESEKGSAYSEVGLGILGCNRAMIANRVSYWLDVKGPSIVMDATCCSSLACFEKAYTDIATGVCDAAIVGASKVLLHPHTLIHYQRMVPQNKDGKTKCYDVDADGQSCSEAINVFLLQKYKDTKRVYASLCYAKTQYGVVDNQHYMKTFGFERDPSSLAKFLRDFYMQAGIPPSLVEYVEGFGAAIPDADKMELQVIDEVFCKERTNPLLVGSVMSNIGYTEAATGTAAVMKILLAYQRGELAANLHCDSPRQDVAALRDGRMRILTDNHRFRRSYAAVNGLSVTGLNGHALLAGNYKPKDVTRYQSEIPYLVTVSGRIESAVQKIIDHLKSRHIDAEEIALLHNIHKYRINGHLARGFGIFSSKGKETITHHEGADYYDDAKRPLWFVYSGMGSQWAGMAAQLMRVPVFAAAIERCRKVLEPKGVDIIHILTSPDKTIYDNILHSFVGIAAVQIGLTDVLTSIGLVPDKIIGHSVGELGCAYADGCLTAEEMILAAYSRGLVSVETSFITGSMAAVGIGYEKILSMLPPEIEVACHNGPESCTISGPATVMREFVTQLTVKGIFAKEVPCSNIAYHSRYIAKAGPGLLQYLNEVIKTPKLRSERWLSTSVPQNRWHEDVAKYSSAEYHTNNLLNPVLFEETARLVPSNAVVVEIAPHGLLQAILKRSLPASCKHVPLTRRGHSDNTLLLLEAIGKLYMNGYDANIAALYPAVEFPVSTETPSLSHLIEWVYADNWKLCLYVPVDRQYSSVYKPIITVHDDEFSFLAGHVIEGTTVFPFSAALVTAWDTLAMSICKPRRSLPVQLRDIHLHVQPRLSDGEALHLTVALQRGSGRFEVSYEHGLIAEGTIVSVSNNLFDLEYVEKDALLLTSNDIYKLLYEKGFEYGGEFRSIIKTDYSFEHGQLVWNNNWVTLIDGLIQLNALKRSHHVFSQPTHIKSLTINPKTHVLNCQSTQDYIDVRIFQVQEVTRCDRVVMDKITFVDKPYIVRQSADLKALQFFPFFLQEDADIYTTLYVFLQIINDNLGSYKINIYDLVGCDRPSIIDNIKYLLSSPPEIKYELTSVKLNEIISLKNNKEKPNLVLVHDLLADKQIMEILFHCLPSNTFIISIGVETEELYPATLYRPVCVRGKGERKIELAIWRPTPSNSTTALTVRNSSDLDFLQATCAHLPRNNKLFVLSSNPPPLGLKEIVKQQKKGYDRNINVAILNTLTSDADQELEDLPRFDLTFNMLHRGQWGGEFYMPLPKNTLTNQTVALRSTQLGKLDSLAWAEVPEVSEGVGVTVHYAALNAYDAKRARAEIPIGNENDGYGLDFSGITDRGDRVFGIVPNGAISSRVSAKPELLWPVPDHWDLEDAATVALPYLQAFYCLTIKTEIRKGMRVLIHGGAGAFGQAAIAVALAARCEVFTTVSDVRKKQFLKQLFPELKANQIGNSRDVTFCDMILNTTQGFGCDVVISSVRGDLKQGSLSCCASSGITLDLVQIHEKENFSYGMYNMTKARSYMPIDFSEIVNSINPEEIEKLHRLVSNGISLGYVRPLSRVTYSPHEAPRAFRLLAASNHRGRVLLRLAGVDVPTTTLAQPRLICSSDDQQLLISDEDVLSLQLTDRLISRGATKLRLYLPGPSGYIKVKKTEWRKRGVQVDTVFSRKWNKDELVQFLHNSKKTGNVESLFIVASASFNNDDSTQKSMIKCLDMELRILFPSMRHFTVISQHPHFAKDICQDRAFYGLPSLSLQLQNLEQFDENGHTGQEVQTERKLKCRVAVDIIERAICSRKPVVSGYVLTVKQRSLLDEIALLPGISITSATDHRSTLEQVGLDQGRAQELCYMLEEKFNIVLPKETLPHMTIAKLKKLQDRFTETSKDEPGLSAYFNAVDADEMVASSDLVVMRTLLHSSGMRPDDVDISDQYLCIIPGVDGYHDRFDILCERLKLPAVVLKPSIDVLDDSIQEMAQRLVNVMLKRLKCTKTFYLLGYELGILVALEMAAILERYGLSGIVYCLGGTPEDIQSMLEIDLNGMTNDKLQDAIAQHLTSLMTRHRIPDLISDYNLKSSKTWQDKVETCLKACHGISPYTSQFMGSYLKSSYNNVELIRKHKVRSYSLISKIVILRAELPCPFNINLMSEFSKQPLAVHHLRGSLSQAPKNLQCSTIINKYLDPALVEAFDSKNQCDTYSVNDHILMKFIARK